MSYRRQKRWWNSYILFYERHDAFQSEDEKDLTKSMQDLTIGKISVSNSNTVSLLVTGLI